MTPTTEQLKDLLDKVTQGDWRVEQNTTLIWGACNPDDTSSRGMGYPIAEARITPISISSWARGPDEDAGEANATLIALAPTLADEVVRLRLHLSRMLMAQDGVPLNAIEFGKWVDEARQALYAPNSK